MTLDWVTALPKAELHIHIEGTLEPELMFDLAQRNQVEIPFRTVDEVRAAYGFSDLQSFLDIYYQGAEVLRTSDDFYDLMSSYLRRAAADGVRHAEIFFDPQTHTGRGVGYPAFMEGFRGAIADAPDGMTADLILCFLRHLTPEDAVETLHQAEGHLEGVVAVGLDSTERDRPNQLFETPFAMARQLGLRAVAHAGEEGPPAQIVAALDVLGAERIDHGVASVDDEELVARLARERVPLTMCPLANVALKVVPRIEDHPIAALLDRGVVVTVNSDDPAYFGSYIGDNYRAMSEGLGLPDDDIATLARNSIAASFLDDGRKQELIGEIGYA